jgi:nicotinamidase-related amidase
MATESELVLPRGTALLMMECQKGVLDPSGQLALLAKRADEKGMVTAIARILAACRRSGRPVVHCLVHTRSDGGGRSRNAPLLRISTAGLPTGSDRAAVVEPLAPIASDYTVARLHGVSPFHGTELDPLLRSLGVTTIIATGVSVNVAVTGMVIEAVNHGYEVVVPVDAIAGVPTDYEEVQIRYCLRSLARLSSADEVAAALGSS